MINSKSFTLGLTLLFFITSLNAQVGIGTTDPQGALDITSTTDGLLIPRVALVNLATVTVVTPTESELVYNTATVNDVTPGYYYLSTATGPWVRIGGATGWLTTGNADIVNGTNFMGTTNNVDVAFRRNNLASGRLAEISTSFGLGALNSTVAGENVAFGNNALRLNTGIQNVALGYNTLASNVDGRENVAIGFQTLQSINFSLRNIGIGHNAMRLINHAGASENVAIGWQSMQDSPTNVPVGFNVFVGAHAGRRYTSIKSVGIGNRALGSMNGGPSNGIENTAVGNESLAFNTTGNFNTAVGSESLRLATTGFENTVVGYHSGRNIENGARNVIIGFEAGKGMSQAGSNNVIIGQKAGISAGTGNIMLGYEAGFADNGSNKLYIHNANASADASLIYGEFNNNILRTNGQLQIGNPAGTGYAFPTSDGTVGQYLQTNGNGAVSWANQSDSKSVMRANITNNQGLDTLGWQKILFNKVLFDTNTEFNTTSSRFVASNAGYYQINAGFHTNGQSNTQFYAIGVYVNGNLYQETSSNHHNNGFVSRNINCIVSLVATDYVEIFVRNSQAGDVQIDSFTGKTFFEVQQIR
ncbi:hypothetical protein FJ651_01050 [Paucihalobacter ruber]|uniref:C1q domain-containing protein n=1 Tax=Paucihalobacter ruber TaxID=2567861 RepID=A0A506PTH8_9FLAO|nr:hypothetical protein [Paucihalobacter ruber]TPV35530.1 hypothetical protein FJ651_01050 [Paucihalobacter ruber]